jgi:hypothetical protein
MCWQAPTRFEQVTYDRSWAKKQNPVNKKERAGGMPTYAPTVKERKIVEKAAGFGLPHDKICQLIVSERAGKPIDPKTLREVFRVELERGVAVADSEVRALQQRGSQQQRRRPRSGGAKRACVGLRRSGIRCPLTIRRQIDIPQSGPGWEGTECNSINQTARVHHAARRRGGCVAPPIIL